MSHAKHNPGRRMLVIIMALVLVLTLLPMGAVPARAVGGNWNGTGAVNDPYLIEDAADLEALTMSMVNTLSHPLPGGVPTYAGQYFKLTANIDLTGVDLLDTYGSGTGWWPISSNGPDFAGTFDGDGHTITGLSINWTGQNIGLFGWIDASAVVENLSVSGSVTGTMFVGGVVGHNEGTVQNCYSTCAITDNSTDNQYPYAGGVVGGNDGTVTNCYNTGAVIGSNFTSTGGVVGYNSGGTVQNCYNAGKVTGGLNVGGAVGQNNSGGTVQNCYFDSTVNPGLPLQTGVTALTTGPMTADNVLTTGAMSGLGAAFVKRPNDADYGYYPELAIFYGDGTLTTPQQIASRDSVKAIALQGTVSFSVDPGTGEVTANTSGITQSLVTLTYTWSVAGQTGTVNTPSGNVYLPAASELGKAIICTVASSDTAGGISAQVAVYRVALSVSGADATYDSIHISDSHSQDYGQNFYGQAGTQINIDYRLGNPGMPTNILKFSNAVSATVTAIGSGLLPYTISASDSAASGVIIINAAFTHSDMATTTVTACAGYGGTITPSGSAGDYTVTPDGGFVIDQVFVDGEDQIAASGLSMYYIYDFPNDGGAHSIFATFGYTANFNAPANGSLTVSSAGSPISSGSLIYVGDQLTITATPGSGYALQSLTVNGADVTASYSSGYYQYTVGTSSVTRMLSDGVTKVSAQGADIEAAFAKASAPGGSGPTTYTITFSTNGGSAVANQSVVSGNKATQPDDPTRDGYAFGGWYSDAGLTVPYDFTRPVTGNLTLYADWTGGPVAPPKGWQNPFTDVGSGDWFYGDVGYMNENALMNGVSDTLFSPNMTTTRGMIVTILYRAAGNPDVSGLANPFSDVTGGQYYTDAVTWAAANGIVTGDGNGAFDPNGNVTREQLAAILYRYAQWAGMDVSVGEDTNILSYNDAVDISEYAISAFQWACGAQVVQGTPDGYLLSQDQATRAEVAAMIHRLLEAANVE